MEITCVQMDVLLSFYIDGELTLSLKDKVEEHLQKCPTCRAKYNILSSLFKDMSEETEEEEPYHTRQYNSFQNNLSAYIDNELSPEENIKIKKYTINNKKARKELEDNYQIRKLMKNSFKKAKGETRPDFSKSVLKQMNLEDRTNFSFNPLVKVGFAFFITVLFLSIIILFSLSM